MIKQLQLKQYFEYRNCTLCNYHTLCIIGLHLCDHRHWPIWVSLDIESTLKSINSLDTTSSLDIRVAPTTRTVRLH